MGIVLGSMWFHNTNVPPAKLRVEAIAVVIVCMPNVSYGVREHNVPRVLRTRLIQQHGENGQRRG